MILSHEELVLEICFLKQGRNIFAFLICDHLCLAVQNATMSYYLLPAFVLLSKVLNCKKVNILSIINISLFLSYF